MRTLKLECEFTYDDILMHGDDKESEDWFINAELFGSDNELYNSDIGDYIGTMKVIKIIEVIK